MSRLTEKDVRLLVQMIIHDLEKPLAVNERILSRMANGSLDIERESHHRLILTAVQASARLRRMLCDMKEVMGGHKPAGRMNRFPLKQVVESAASEFLAMAETEGVNFEWKCTDDIIVHSDPDLLQRVMENYLHNALSHTPEGNRIWLNAVPRGREGFLVSVGNMGPAIPEEHLENIFQEGVQLNLRSEMKWLGQGLGLAFCRMAAEAMGGKVWAENLENCDGVTFYLECNS